MHMCVLLRNINRSIYNPNTITCKHIANMLQNTIDFGYRMNSLRLKIYVTEISLQLCIAKHKSLPPTTDMMKKCFQTKGLWQCEYQFSGF